MTDRMCSYAKGREFRGFSVECKTVRLIQATISGSHVAVMALGYLVLEP